MADHVHILVLDRPNDTVGRLGFVLGQRVVRAGDDEIELSQYFVLVIEPTVGENIHFATGKEGDLLVLAAHVVDRLDVRQQTFNAQAVRCTWLLE